MNQSVKNRVERFFYTRIIKPIIFNSRLGRKTMFGYADSGLNFDHIYKNEAKGYNRLGQVIDRILLNLPACKATRHRKDRIVEILKEEVQNNTKKGVKTRIVDIASGPARYIVDAITNGAGENVEVLCFDINEHSIRYGMQIASGKPILFRKVNTLNIKEHYKRLSAVRNWHPNVIISSGFYEYLTDDQVKASLKKVIDFLDKNGLSLFITQKSNPNKKLIEYVGITGSGKPWILYYREPHVLREWMREAGFEDIEFEIDQWGMYEFFKGRKIIN